MPDQTYEVVMHDGRKFHVVADHQPTEEEVLASLPKEADAPKLMASHEAPVDKAEALDTALGAMGSVGIPGALPGGPIGAAAARFVGNPKNAPALGATAASLATGGAAVLPAVLAATAGGAGGSVARDAAEYFTGIKPSPTMTGVLTDAAKEGVTQGAVQAVGGGLSKLTGMTGRGLYGKALAPSTKLAKDFGRGAIIDAGIEEGIVPGTAGAAAAGAAARGQAHQEAAGLVTNSPAAKAGVRVTPQSIVSGLDPLRAEVASRPAANVARQQIDRFGENFIASHPKAKTLEELMALKRGAQEGAGAAYRAADTGGVAGMDAEGNEAIGKRTRQIIEQFVPESKAANTRTAARVGLTRALEDEQVRNHILSGLLSATAGAGTGYATGDPLKGAGAAATTFALRDPRALGALGIALGRTGGGAGQIPAAAIRAALLQQMGGDQPQQP